MIYHYPLIIMSALVSIVLLGLILVRSELIHVPDETCYLRTDERHCLSTGLKCAWCYSTCIDYDTAWEFANQCAWHHPELHRHTCMRAKISTRTVALLFVGTVALFTWVCYQFAGRFKPVSTAIIDGTTRLLTVFLCVQTVYLIYIGLVANGCLSESYW